MIIPRLTPLLLVAVAFAGSGPAIYCSPQPPSPGASTGPYTGFGYAWENNNLGIDRTVPEPWTPVVASGRTLNVWGRSFRYGKGPLPAQIVTQGEELFTSPPGITLSANGGTLDLAGVESHFETDGHPDRATVRCQATNDDLRVTADSVLEFDGFLRVDLTLTPVRDEARIDTLLVNLPLRAAAAKYFSHGYGYDFVAQRPAGRDTILNTAGAIKGRIAKPFNHHFWVGSEQGGIEVESPTNLEWSPRQPDEAIEIVPQGETVLFRLNVITEARVLKAATRLSFAFYITPVKPMPEKWRARIVGNSLLRYAEGPDSKRIITQFNPKLWQFYTFRPGPSASLPLERFGMPWPPTDPGRRSQYDRLRKDWRRYGMRVAPYGALMGLDGGLPELREYSPYWLFNPASRRRAISPEEAALHSEGHVTITLYSKSIQDFLVWTYVQSAREWGYDGLYFDLADPRTSDLNPAAADVDVRSHSGKLYSPLFEIREFHKRLYKATKAVHPGFQIEHHHGKGSYFDTAFADISFTGEGLNAMFYDDAQFPRPTQRRSSASAYEPDYSLVPDDYYLAAYGPPKGCVEILIPQILKSNPNRAKQGKELAISNAEALARLRSDPNVFEHYNRVLLSRTLILQLPLVRIRMDEALYDRVMLVFEKAGGLKDPLSVFSREQMGRFVRNADACRLNAIAYVWPGSNKALLVLANWHSEPVKETLAIDAGALNLDGGRIARVSDCEGRDGVNLDDFRLSVAIPANDFRLLLIE